jgi:hypothetical protein
MVCGLVAFLFWSYVPFRWPEFALPNTYPPYCRIPGAAGLAAIAAAVRSFPDKLPPIVLALLTGLNASAVGLIALAAYQLSLGSVTDGLTRLVVVTSASFGICYHAPWVSCVTRVQAGGDADDMFVTGVGRCTPFW